MRYPTFRMVAFIVLALILVSPTIQSSGQSSGRINAQPSQPGIPNGLVPIRARKHAPDLSVSDIAGNRVSLSQ